MGNLFEFHRIIICYMIFSKILCVDKNKYYMIGLKIICGVIDRFHHSLLYLRVNKLYGAIIRIRFLFSLKIFITFVFAYRVNNCKDFYDVLSIKKDATDTEIKKAYKKLALVLHPDKNHAPGAAEAFKTVGNAVATLTDAEKRKRYDMVGHENSTSDHVHRNYDHGFESDITAEQLFNMFFNGAFPTRQGPMTNPYYTRSFSRRWPPETDNDNHQQQESSSIYFQLLPILLLLLLSLFSNFSYDPVYTLKHSAKYPVLRRTSFRDISYFVKDNFHTDYTGDLRRLEHTIEEDYINTVRTKCIREKEYYESLMWRARLDDDSTLFNKATKYQMKSCEEYQTLMKQKYK